MKLPVIRTGTVEHRGTRVMSLPHAMRAETRYVSQGTQTDPPTANNQQRYTILGLQVMCKLTFAVHVDWIANRTGSDSGDPLST